MRNDVIMYKFNKRTKRTPNNESVDDYSEEISTLTKNHFITTHVTIYNRLSKYRDTINKKIINSDSDICEISNMEYCDLVRLYYRNRDADSAVWILLNMHNMIVESNLTFKKTFAAAVDSILNTHTMAELHARMVYEATKLQGSLEELITYTYILDELMDVSSDDTIGRYKKYITHVCPEYKGERYSVLLDTSFTTLIEYLCASLKYTRLPVKSGRYHNIMARKSIRTEYLIDDALLINMLFTNCIIESDLECNLQDDISDIRLMIIRAQDNKKSIPPDMEFYIGDMAEDFCQDVFSKYGPIMSSHIDTKPTDFILNFKYCNDVRYGSQSLMYMKLAMGVKLRCINIHDRNIYTVSMVDYYEILWLHFVSKCNKYRMPLHPKFYNDIISTYVISSEIVHDIMVSSNSEREWIIGCIAKFVNDIGAEYAGLTKILKKWK